MINRKLCTSLFAGLCLVVGTATGGEWKFVDGQWDSGAPRPQPKDGLVIAENGKALMEILLPDEPTLQERTAAAELKLHLDRATGGDFVIVNERLASAPFRGIHVGNTRSALAIEPGIPTMDGQAWRYTVDGGNIFLFGGHPRGTLYAVYRFLENELGVYWWTTRAQTIPRSSTLVVGRGTKEGVPGFDYRDVSHYYAKDRLLNNLGDGEKLRVVYFDHGKFAARNLSGGIKGSVRFDIAPEYGGEMHFTGPYSCHTFYHVIDPKKYFESKPEWFSLIDGTRQHVLGQLDVMNPEMRLEYLEKLKGYLREAQAENKKLGYESFRYVDVSPNDWEGYDEGPASRALVEKEGTEMAPILDFVNYLAENLQEEFPGFYVRTLAYKSTRTPPRTMRAHDRVIVTVSDTETNPTKPIAESGNGDFHSILKRWREVAKHVWVWDYATAYGVPGIAAPAPLLRPMVDDFKEYHRLGVEGIHLEQGYPWSGDNTDAIHWVLTRALEKPDADYDDLAKTFTDGFYGPAGKYIREYYKLLEAAAQGPAAGNMIQFGSHLPEYRYLDEAFFKKAAALFDSAEDAVVKVTDAPEALQRVREARRTLDEAAIRLASGQTGKPVAGIDLNAAVARYKNTAMATIQREVIPERQHFALDLLDQWLLAFQSRPPRSEALPSTLRSGDVYFVPPGIMTWHRGIGPHERNNGSLRMRVRLEKDGDAGGVLAVRLLAGAETPLNWFYVSTVKTLKTGGPMPLDEMKGAYNWVRLGDFEVTRRGLISLFATKEDPIGCIYIFSDYFRDLYHRNPSGGRAEAWILARKETVNGVPTVYIAGAALKSLGRK